MFDVDLFLVISLLQQALLALSLYLPLMSGQLSLATPGFYAVGGYLAAIFSSRFASQFVDFSSDSYPWYFMLGEMMAAGLLCFILAQAIGRLVLRLRGIYLALATLALVEIIRVTCLNLEWTGGAIGIFSIPQVVKEQNFYLAWFLPLFIMTLLLVLRLEKLQFGKALRALREDESAAAAMGIDPARCKTMAFALGSALAGVTGALSAHLLNTWNARQGTFDSSINILAYVVIGGPWSAWGASLGAMLLTALPELLRPLQDYRLLVNGVLILIACLFLPKGLVPDQWLQRLRGKKRQQNHELLGKVELNGINSRSQTDILVVQGLSIRFGGIKALQDFSFSVRPGEIFGIIGPNGAGKSTVFNLLSGFLQANSGAIHLEGKDITRLSVHTRAALGMARTFQNLRLFKTQSAIENVLAATHLREPCNWYNALLNLPKSRQWRADLVKEARHYLDICGLLNVAEQPAISLSYGDQKRLELARALMLRPKLLLLDEPVAGMNGSEKSTMEQLLRKLRVELGLTIVLIEHHVPMVMGLCDRIAVLNFGQLLASGQPTEMQLNPAVQEAYLGPAV